MTTLSPLRLIASAVSGILFGFGLALSGMTSPAKVLGFLDVTGQWDPSLAGVMAGAIPVAALLFALTRKRGRCLDGGVPPTPSTGKIDRPLLLGAAIFGAGWGLAGLCPGPAIADLVVDSRILVFLAAMIIGFILHARLR